MLHYAVTYGNIDIVDYLMHNGLTGLEYTKRGYYPIHEAAAFGQLEIFQYLCQG